MFERRSNLIHGFLQSSNVHNYTSIYTYTIVKINAMHFFPLRLLRNIYPLRFYWNIRATWRAALIPNFSGFVPRTSD